MMIGKCNVAAIRAQMEALDGHTSGPWHDDLGETYRAKSADGMNIATANWVTLLGRLPSSEVKQNIALIAAAPDMRATILALCDALDGARTRDCPLGEDCDLTTAYMAGRGRYRDDMRVLRAENERLRAALRPFAAAADDYCDPAYDDDYAPEWAEFFTIGDFRRARAALAQKGGEE